MKIKIYLYITILFILLSCKDNNSQIFVGAFRVLDQMIPYPYIIQQKSDSIYLFNNKGEVLDRIKSTNKNIEELKFNQKDLKVIKKIKDDLIVFDLEDTLNFKRFKNGKPIPKYSAKFIKTEVLIGLDIKKIKKEIENFIWKYEVIKDENNNPNRDLKIKKLLQFKNDSLTILTNYYYQGLKTVSEYEIKAYNIFEIDSIYFLSFQKENDNPQSIYQIINFNSSSMELKDFSSKETKNIIFNKNSFSNEEYKELIANTPYFANCFDGYQAEYYRGDDVTFNKGNEYITNFVNVDVPKNETKSGYIIVHFNINCKGNVGRFGLIQMNREYREISFSKEMINHLLNKVSQLKDFPSTYSQLDWLDYKDVHAFLMFKLEKGKIVDLCP